MKPLVVTAAVPSLIPLVTNGEAGSLGIVFLLHVMLAASRSFSTSLPVFPLLKRLTSIRWLSVPPDTISKPLFISPLASADAFLTTFSAYTLKLGSSASFKHTALPAITCIRGPPWIPGNTDLLSLNFSAASAEARIIPPLGPRSVLCVVVVVTSAYGIGLGCAPPATRPAICAISTISNAPTSSQISLNFLKSIVLA